MFPVTVIMLVNQSYPVSILLVFIIDIIQGAANIVSSLLTCEKLRHQILNIVICWNVSCQWLLHHNSLHHLMITSWVTIFPHIILCTLSFVDNWYISPIYVLSPVSRNSHHPQLVLEALECFHSVLHHQKLRTKKWYLNCRLFLGNTLDHRHNPVDKESCP